LVHAKKEKNGEKLSNGSEEISTAGFPTFNCHSTERAYNLLFYAVKGNVQPGLSDCLQMKLVSLNKEIHHVSVDEVSSFASQIHSDYPDLFKDEIDKFPLTYSMKLDPAMPGRVKSELQRMVKIGVLTPVSEPTEWV